MADERRRFFRIDDALGVSYRVLIEEELRSRPLEGNHPVDAFSLISGYETKIENYLGQLRVQNPLVAALMDTVNKKINCVIGQLELESRLVQRLAHKVQEVNISACGMAFTVEQAVDAGSVLSINLMLCPTNLQVASLGTVISCEAYKDTGKYYLRVDFHNMEPADQEVLIQHIVRRQGRILRAAREEGTEPLSASDQDLSD